MSVPTGTFGPDLSRRADLTASLLVGLGNASQKSLEPAFFLVPFRCCCLFVPGHGTTSFGIFTSKPTPLEPACQQTPCRAFVLTTPCGEITGAKVSDFRFLFCGQPCTARSLHSLEALSTQRKAVLCPLCASKESQWNRDEWGVGNANKNMLSMVRGC